MNDSDLNLWLRVRANDSSAFAVLFERYANDVYNFCFRRTGNWSRAQDLVSDVFLEAWRKRRRLELTSEDQRLRPWLIGVAHNKIRNETRQLSRMRAALRRLQPSPAPADTSPSSFTRLEEEDRMSRLIEAMKALPGPEADVLILFAWGDLRYQEIADALGIPIGTVRSRLARARARFQEPGVTSGHEASETSPLQEGQA